MTVLAVPRSTAMSPPPRSRPPGVRRRLEPPKSPLQAISWPTQAHLGARAYAVPDPGGVAEWTNAAVLKTVDPGPPGPWVRIPPPPLRAQTQAQGVRRPIGVMYGDDR